VYGILKVAEPANLALMQKVQTQLLNIGCARDNSSKQDRQSFKISAIPATLAAGVGA
jgi:hypothetical protein